MSHILALIGPALGHVSRVLQIARQLRRHSGARITFVSPGPAEYLDLAANDGFDTVRIARNGADDDGLAFRLETAVHDLHPDLIVQDMSPTPFLAATRWPDCPRVLVTNAFLTGPAGKQTVQTEWFDTHGPRINAARTARGLAPLSSGHQLYEADLVLCADPDVVLRALPPLPGHYRAIGHIRFEVDAPVPEALREDRDLMILSMGSTGPRRFDAAILDAARGSSGSRRTVYVGDSGDAVAATGLVDMVCDWLPTHLLLDRTRVVITQGGAGSSYQALDHGCPVIVLPDHRNQCILGEILESAGVGAGDGRPGLADRLARVDFAAMGARARAVGQQMRTAPDGADLAARAILALLRGANRSA